MFVAHIPTPALCYTIRPDFKARVVRYKTMKHEGMVVQACSENATSAQMDLR